MAKKITLYGPTDEMASIERVYFVSPSLPHFFPQEYLPIQRFLACGIL